MIQSGRYLAMARDAIQFSFQILCEEETRSPTLWCVVY